MILSATLLGAALAVEPLRLPLVATRGVALVIAAATAFVAVVIPQSLWRVPREWGYWGPQRYAAAFGFLLGLGFVTAIPSPAFYVLIVLALSNVSPALIVAVFASFGAIRALPLVIASVASARSGEYPTGIVERFRVISDWAAPVEIVLLVALAVAA